MIGRYAVKRLLGAGAMGSVYLAEDPNIKRRIAIKMVKADLVLNEEDRKEVLARFQREAEVSGLLNHPSIVAIYDFGESEAGTYLAMEYVEGRPLDALIKAQDPLSIGERFRILLGIGEALDHAHTKGIIHRDVKPGNVMIGLDGRPKLMDFGIAKREDASLTQTGTFLGTPSYASPEQIREGIVDNRSDIFSFGVMAFELFVGQTPFPGSSINTILYRIVNEPPTVPDPPVEGVVPAQWVQVFEKVLAKRPQDRYPTCQAFLADLGMAIPQLEEDLKARLARPGTERGVPSLPETRDPQQAGPAVTQKSQPTPKASKLPWVLATLAVGGALAGYGMLRFRSGTQPAPAQAQPTPAKGEAAAPPAPAPVQPAPPPAAPSEPGILKVAGAFPVRLRLEGRDLGELAPGKTLELAPGVHHLELQNPKVFFRETRRVSLASGTPSVLSLPPLVQVKVFTFPGSGLVTVDGLLSGVESDGERTIAMTRGAHVFGIQGRPVRFAATVQEDGQVVKFGGVPAQ